MREEAPQFWGVYALGARTQLSRFLPGPDSQMALTAVDCYPFPSSLGPQSTSVSYPTSPLDTLGLVHPIPFITPPLRLPSSSLHTVGVFDVPFRPATL